MTHQKRLILALVAILLPLFVVGILLASEPESAPSPAISVMIAPINADKASQSPEDLEGWPIFRHDNGHTGFNPDVGVFRPPLAQLDPIKLQDVTTDPKPIFNVVTGPERIFVMGQWSIWGLQKDDPSIQWRNDDCLPNPGTGDFCFNNYLAYASDSLVVLRQNFFLSTLEFGYELVVLYAETGVEEWSRSLGETAPEIALDGDSILVLIEEGSEGKLLKLSIGGNQEFLEGADMDGASSGRAVVASGRFIYPNGDRILAYNTNDGQPAWIYADTSRIDPRDYDLVSTSDAVIVSQDERVIRLDAANGAEEWSESVKPQTCASTNQPNAAATDGNIIAVTGVCDDEVVGLNYADGQEKWRKSIGLQTASAVAIGGDVLYVASVTTPIFNIYALDPESGAELEHIELNASESSSVLAISDGLLMTASNIGTKRLQRFERMPADLSAELSLGSFPACDAAVGASLTFNFLVTNHGLGTTDNTRADFILPDGVATLATSLGSCTDGAAPFCELGSLSVDQQVYITATVVLSKAGSYAPGISLSDEVGDPDETNNSDSQPLTVNPAVPAGLDLQLTDIEITQGIQNLANEVNLVNGKATMVRLYGQTNGDPVTDISAVLHGEDLFTGDNLGTLTPIATSNCLAMDGDTPDRDRQSDSFIFELPETWLSGGVIFTAEINPLGAIPETNYTNNTLEITRGFTRLPRVCLKTYPVRSTGTPAGGTTETDNLSPDDRAIFNDFGNILSRALTMLPVREIKVYPSSHLIEEWEPFSEGGWGPYEFEDGFFDDNRGDILDTLWWLYVFGDDPDLCDADDSRTHYIGMVDQGTNNTVGSAGLGTMDGVEAMLFLNTGPNPPQAFDDPHGGFTLAHEIGHNYNRKHVNCGTPPPVGNGPYPSDRDICNIAPIDPRGFYGLEFRDPTSPVVITPTMAGDLMSYADDVWSSEFTWEAIQDVLCDANDCTFPSSAYPKSGNFSPPPPLTGDVLVVRGQISPTITMSNTYRLPVSQMPKADEMWAAQIAARPPTAVYALNLISGTTILHSEPFTPTDYSSRNTTRLGFGLIVPWDPLTTRIEITATGSVVISLTVSPSPPTITALLPNGGESFTDTLPISWTASDPDGDDLFYTVLYSADDGGHWQTLASGVETTTLEIDISLLPGSDGQSLVKVIASDGLNYALRQSEAGFSVPDRAPMPVILYPDDGGEYGTGNSFMLRGSAYDPEDDYLEGDVLRWYLSGIGEVGTGESAIISNLDNGIYTVILAATDSQSHTVTTTVTFTISPPGGYVAPSLVNIDGPASGVTNDSILFDAVVNPISTTTPITFVWQASGLETVTDTGGIGDIQSFSWDEPGPKTITVTVMNPAGEITGYHAITISEQAIANFSAAPTSGGAPLLVDFTNLSAGNFDSCTWEFGDGSGSNDCNDPSHIYRDSGVFTISLTITGTGGTHTVTKTNLISVTDVYYVFVPVLNKPN